ncbi:DUF1697 domain-containing protein [Roseiterribacter gracilis]|uniref:DUF1697 domain-containing protein n=1 Tax=Roseiterribacter gracilis TaxID=2812848 RepID=A0A8S8XED6_9PROT|nr:hypothetical protein TMPK1_32110 [Rhodospirillales bacterium TMPK1]
MTIRIALYRAVNLGAKTKLQMAPLRAMAGELGLGNPRTLIASGNLVFDGGAKKESALEKLLEKETEAQFGLKTDIFVRTVPDWDAIIAANPFPQQADDDPSHLLAMVLRDVPASDAELQAAMKGGTERAKIVGRCAYLYYPDGVGESRITTALIERKLGTRGTARNWNTVRKLQVLAQS